MAEEERPAAAGNFYSLPDVTWIEPGFALGSRPYDHQRPAIAGLGIELVIALHEPEPEEFEDWQRLGVRLVSIPTADWVEIAIRTFDRAVDAVCDCLHRERPVLLHCLAGLNRAPTVAAAVLCRRHAMDVDSALAAVHRARPAARPTPEQERSLRRWEALRCT